jgi:hypothetical protein
VRDIDTVWEFLVDHNFITIPIALSRTTALLNRGRESESRAVWTRFVSAQNEVVTDPGFETPWSGEGFDWRTDSCPGVTIEPDQRIAHSGKRSLRIQFHADSNLDFRHVSQRVWLAPGRYLLSAWVRTEGLSTDEGIGLRIAGLRPSKPDSSTETLQGTHDWTRLQTEFSAGAAPRLARIEIFRNPSLRFDSKPQGIDDVIVARVP